MMTTVWLIVTDSVGASRPSSRVQGRLSPQQLRHWASSAT